MDRLERGYWDCFSVRPRQIEAPGDTHTLWLQEKVRTKAITVRKVWGEVNPADLFTKHLPSREKVHQLLGLFGCECRDGRAASAPLLRPLDDDRKGGHPVIGEALPTYVADIEGAPRHDESRLPHMYPEREIARLFPVIEAAPEQPNVRDYVDDRHRHDDLDNGRRHQYDSTTATTGPKMDHRRGAAPRGRAEIYESADPPRRFSSSAGNG